MPRRDREYDYARREDRNVARRRFPHPAVMNVGTGRFHDALDALDAKDTRLDEAATLLGDVWDKLDEAQRATATAWLQGRT